MEKYRGYTLTTTTRGCVVTDCFGLFVLLAESKEDAKVYVDCLCETDEEMLQEEV